MSEGYAGIAISFLTTWYSDLLVSWEVYKEVTQLGRDLNYQVHVVYRHILQTHPLTPEGAKPIRSRM